MSCQAAARLASEACAEIHKEPSPTGTPPPVVRAGSGAVRICTPGYWPEASTASAGPMTPEASNVMAALPVAIAIRWSMLLGSEPVARARCDVSIWFHHLHTFSDVGLVRLACVARAMRPLPLLTYWPPLLASRNSKT